MTLETLYKKDRKAFISKLYPFVRGYDVAEDLVQEAFSKALKNYSQYDPDKGPLKGWFIKVLFSCLWNYKRSLKRIPYFLDIDDVLENDFLAHHEEETLYPYLLSMHNKVHKKVLICYFIFGYTAEEISGLLPVTQDNVRKIVQRFRETNKYD